MNNKKPVFFLIDDDPDDREIFSIALEDASKNCKCITARSGLDALDKLKTDENLTPDYIFLDLNMPILSGKDCLVELKKIPRLSAIPVVIYTTSSLDKDIEEIKLLGASHYLIKPSNMKTLTKILLEFMNTNQPAPFLLQGIILGLLVYIATQIFHI
jgi:CheY-like chemotaxis protein